MRPTDAGGFIAFCGAPCLRTKCKGGAAIDREDFFETFSGGMMRAELCPNDMLLFRRVLVPDLCKGH